MTGRRPYDKNGAAPRPRYWIGVASREHVRVGVRGGFAQFSHGKPGPAKRLSKGDWVVYYSSKKRYGEPEPCQRFTAIGEVVDAAPVQVQQHPGFRPWRRKVAYRKAAETDIHPLIDQLSFIRDKTRWGGVFRFGFLEIGAADFATIARRMLRVRQRRISASVVRPVRSGRRPPH